MIAEEIVRRVSYRTGIPVSLLRGDSRKRNVAHARQRAMWAMRQVKGPDGKPRLSTTWIGRYMGGRDHTTVTFAERAHAPRRQATHVARRGRRS